MDDDLPEQGFSIEMKTMDQARAVSMSEVFCEEVLREGVLGAFEEIGVLEEANLMVMGAQGTLRIDQKEKGLSSAMSKDKATTDRS